MKRFRILLVFANLLACTAAEPDKSAPQVPGVADPRLIGLTLLYRDGKQAGEPFSAALMVYARWDVKPPNTIIGIEGSFTDEQIISALTRFYRDWRPSAEDTSTRRPGLVLASQNWGSGASLYRALKDLSAEFGIDVYVLYPVVTHIERQPFHPTANDKRLAELIKGL